MPPAARRTTASPGSSARTFLFLVLIPAAQQGGAERAHDRRGAHASRTGQARGQQHAVSCARWRRPRKVGPRVAVPDLTSTPALPAARQALGLVPFGLYRRLCRRRAAQGAKPLCEAQGRASLTLLPAAVLPQRRPSSLPPPASLPHHRALAAGATTFSPPRRPRCAPAEARPGRPGRPEAKLGPAFPLPATPPVSHVTSGP